ncbi:MAG: phage terminase large subunit [Acidobacteriota bacterium]|nr:phage terminase large subunit [Acidobacteriota bacterium]
MTASSTLSSSEYQVVLRNDLTTFIERSFYELNPQATYLPGLYIELIASALEKCRTGGTKRLIINLPPRTLKSHAASVVFPAWLLGHDPSKQIICVSYGQDLSDKHARDSRTLMNSSFYRGLFPATVLSAEKLSVADFLTTAQGSRMSTSVGGTLTGRGAEVLIIDDPMKPEEALSESRRRTSNDWYFNTLLSRLNSKDNGVIILVMQRLHQADLVGEVLEREHWEVLSLPAMAERDESYLIESQLGNCTYVRKVGEALHPERDSLETYRNIREAIGEYNFQSQYQQNPTTREGGLIKREWIKYCEPADWPRVFEYVLQSWDTAIKSGDRNDYSVCTTWGIYNGNFYLMDVFRKRLVFPDLKRAVLKLFRNYDVQKLLIEDKGSGSSLIQELQPEYIWCLEGYTPNQTYDKQMRLDAQSIKFESGRVFLPVQAPWLVEYVNELTGFPGSKYDDQVDSTSQALEYLGPFAFVADCRPYCGVPKVYDCS